MVRNRRPAALPVELQLEIIDIVGEEAAFRSKDKFELDRDWFETLCNMSSICKEWRSMALRHIFRRMRLTTHWRKIMTYKRHGERGRLDCLLPLLKCNPNIAGCVQIVYLAFPTPDAEEQHALIEEVSRYITPITTLTIDFEGLAPFMNSDWSLQGHPHLHSAFHTLTRTPKLRELHLLSGRLHTSLLEDVKTLESLDLSDSSPGLVVDHRTPSALPRPRKLVVEDSLEALIVEVEGNPEIRDLFSDVEHLTTLSADITKPYRWGEMLDLGHLASLSLHCCASLNRGGWGDRLFVFLRNRVPWESFTHLNSLSLSISSNCAPRLGHDNPDDFFDLAFSGPSRLPRLSSLQIKFCLYEDLVYDKSEIPDFLHMLYWRSLDRTFKDQSSFTTLTTFQTKIHLITSLWPDIKLKSLIRGVKEQLPSVFGPEGRRETHGWKTVVSAKAEEYINPDSYPEPDQLINDSDDDKEEDELYDILTEKMAMWSTPEIYILNDTSSLDLNDGSSDSE